MMNKLLVYLLFVMIAFTACQDDGDTTDTAQLQQQVEELKALLEQQKSITDVTFDGNEMVLTFGNGSTVRTTAPASIIPYIGENGNWWVNGEDLGVKAEAEIPSIGSNGNWWVGDTDTGVKAQGETGTAGADGRGIDKVDYDAQTAVLKIILTDGTAFEYKLFYEDSIQGIKLGDLNGKYLLSGITNGDFPFADFVYNTNNQLTDINYYVSLLNAPVKNATLKRTYNSNNKIESQSLIEYAIKDKAVQVGEILPNSSYNHEGGGIQLTCDEAYNELFPTGIPNYTGTAQEFFELYKSYTYLGIRKDNYFYNIYDTWYWDEAKQTEVYEFIVFKTLIRTDQTKNFAISEYNGEKLIWSSDLSYWDGVLSWGEYFEQRNVYNSSNIAITADGYLELTGGSQYCELFMFKHKAVEYTTTIDEVASNYFKDYIAIESGALDNPDNLTGTYKILFKEYDLYKKREEIKRVTFAYAYDGDNQSVTSEGKNLYKLKVADGRIDAIVGYDTDGVTELEVLKLSYVDGRLTTISSPQHNVTDIVKIVYDAENNPIEYQVNSKDLAGKGMDDLLATIGLAYRSDVYDESLGMVVEKYIYPENYTPLIKVKYDYTMKNFMNHTITAANPLFSAFNQENAIQELVWAGHGSCFFAEYMDFNEGGYPTKVKGYLQISPFYEYGDDTDRWDDYNQDDRFEYPVNGSVATSYKFQYKKIEE